MQEMHWKIEKSRTKIESCSATRILLRKNALDNEKLVSRDSAYCLHFSALAFLHLSAPAGFYCSRLLVSLSFSRSDDNEVGEMLFATRLERVPRESIFLSPLFCIGSRLMQITLRFCA